MTQTTPIATPERLLARNDSKNPATTCKGLTSSGRPCRRALAISKLVLNDNDDVDGVVAVVHQDGHLTDAQYFCWQHKDQVQTNSSRVVPDTASRVKLHTQSTQVFELKNRSSIDSLMQNLNIQKNERARVDSRRTRGSQHDRSERRRPSRQVPQPRKPSTWKSLCCLLATDEDDTIEIIRHKRRVEQGRNSHSAIVSVPPARKSNVPAHVSQKDVPTSDQPLSYIRPGTSPQIAANLLTELAKPISAHDEEGYIYMFWLTSESTEAPREETAKSLLSLETGHERRLSDIMSEFSVPGNEAKASASAQKQIMVKIGRASNVTRRMNEWQRQCGYKLSLIRWYPYISRSSDAYPGRPHPIQSLYPDLSQHGKPTTRRQEDEGPKKTPHIRRVERLIHLELSGHQVKRQCATCGREHREWFMVKANEHSVRHLDEVIRRWVDWAEKQH